MNNLYKGILLQNIHLNERWKITLNTSEWIGKVIDKKHLLLV